MFIIIFFVTFLFGSVLNKIIDRLGISIFGEKVITRKYFAPIIYGVVLSATYLYVGWSFVFMKAVILGGIFIVVSIIDFKYRVIPDNIILVMLVVGIIFCLTGKMGIVNGLCGMAAGGGLLFLASLMPGMIGGGDVKFMGTLGIFLGFSKTLWALLITFSLASIVSIVLILFKVLGLKDYIPLGPFLAVGGYISFILSI